MNITYYLDDGFAGSKGRPHHISISDEDIEDCESQEELDAFIEENIMDHFHQTVSPYWDKIIFKPKG